MPDLTNAPGTMALGGKVLIVDKMSLSTAGPLHQWMKKRAKELKSPFKNVLEKLDDIPEAYRAAVMQEAAKATISQEVTDQDLNDSLVSPEGCAFLLWLLTRRSHKELDLASIQAEVNSDNFLEVFLEVKSAAYLDDFQKMAEAKLHGANS
jgi:acetyl-CoA carboxylase alpha subunit